MGLAASLLQGDHEPLVGSIFLLTLVRQSGEYPRGVDVR